MEERFSVILDRKLAERFDLTCHRHGVTKKHVITKLVEQYLADAESEPTFFERHGRFDAGPRKEVKKVRK